MSEQELKIDAAMLDRVAAHLYNTFCDGATIFNLKECSPTIQQQWKECALRTIFVVAGTPIIEK